MLHLFLHPFVAGEPLANQTEDENGTKGCKDLRATKVTC